MIHLITPEEAEKAKISSIPDYVFQAFNELLAENFVGNGFINHNTFTLVKQISDLIQNGVSPDKIVAFTFTK